MAQKITVTESIIQFLKENVSTKVVDAEVEKVLKEAIPKVRGYITTHNNCKIGKSGSIEKRFDKTYQDEGYIQLEPIASCKYKEVMDQVELYLIKYFSDYLDNKTDLEVGNKTYSGDYWIYLVHKGEIKPNDEGKTK